MDCSIGFIEAMMDKNEYDEALVREDMEAVYPALAKVFTPSLALATLQNLKRRLDRPEIYQLNDYHYRLRAGSTSPSGICETLLTIAGTGYTILQIR